MRVLILRIQIKWGARALKRWEETEEGWHTDTYVSYTSYSGVFVLLILKAHFPPERQDHRTTGATDLSSFPPDDFLIIPSGMCRAVREDVCGFRR